MNKKLISVCISLFMCTTVNANTNQYTQQQLDSGKYYGPSDLVKKNSKFKQSLSKSFKVAKIKQPSWILSGVETPLKSVDIDGRIYASGNVCQPHLCSNNFTFIYDQQNNHIVGYYNNDDINIHNYVTDSVATNNEIQYIRSN